MFRKQGIIIIDISVDFINVLYSHYFCPIMIQKNLDAKCHNYCRRKWQDVVEVYYEEDCLFFKKNDKLLFDNFIRILGHLQNIEVFHLGRYVCNNVNCNFCQKIRTIVIENWFVKQMTLYTKKINLNRYHESRIYPNKDVICNHAIIIIS